MYDSNPILICVGQTDSLPELFDTEKIYKEMKPPKSVIFGDICTGEPNQCVSELKLVRPRRYNFQKQYLPINGNIIRGG